MSTIMRGTWRFAAAVLLAALTAGCRTGSAERALAERRASVESQFQRAVRLVQSGKRERARESLRAVLETNPDHLSSRLFYAGLLREAGEEDAALAMYDQAVKTAETRATNTVDRVMAHANRGDCLLEAGRYQEAEADFTQALILKPDEAALQFKRGESRMGLREYGKALDDFTLTVRQTPLNSEVWMRRGDCQFAMTNLKAAAEDYTAAIERAPREASLFSRRGAVCEAMDDYTLAMADYSRAIELEPDASRHWYDRGMTRLALEQGKGALSDFNEALARDPKRPETLVGRGLAYELLGDDVRALQDHNQALLVAPGYEPAERQRKRLLDRAGVEGVKPLRAPRFIIDGAK